MTAIFTLSGPTLRSMSLALVILILLEGRGGAQPDSVSLSVDPSSVSSGGAVCPDRTVYFDCIAEEVLFLRWLRNGNEIEDFTSRDNAPIQRILRPYTVFLNSSTAVLAGSSRRNLTSTLVGRIGLGLQSGDRIECVDNTGQLITLNFTQISAPPAPTGYRNTITRSSLLNFDFIWDISFNTANNVSTYRLLVNDSSIVCPGNCSSEDPCQCSGLTAGRNVSITVSAVSCENLEGPTVTVNVAPQVPTMVIECRSHPVYDSTGNLTMIQTTWNKTRDPPEIAVGLNQKVTNYSVTINDDSTNIAAVNACPTTECFFLYSIQMSSTRTGSNLVATVTAANVVGGGPTANCSLPPVKISQNNTVFELFLSTTLTNNRMVQCTQLYQGPGTFLCEFCFGSVLRVCYDLSNNSLANAALDLLGDGSYIYQATAYIDGVPIASIYDNFSTSCQPSELGVANINQTNPLCDLDNIGGGNIQNGVVCYNGTVAGSLATYKCNEGSTLAGTDQRECKSDGRWSGRTPSCSMIDVGAPYTQVVTISLLVLTPILWLISIVLFSIRIVLFLKPVCKPCSLFNLKETVLKWYTYTFIVEVVLIPVVIILWSVYFDNRNGLSQGNSLIAAFVFSSVLFLWCVPLTIARVVMFLHNSRNESFKGPPDNHREKADK